MTFDTEILPNSPARLVTDLRKDKFRLDYAGGPVVQATVRLRRGEELLSLKEGGARLIAISKSDGWDQVTQTVRASAVALSPGDTLLIKGSVCGPLPAESSDDAPAEGLKVNGSVVYCPARDIQVLLEPSEAIIWSDETAKTSATGTAPARAVKINFEAAVDELNIVFRPQFSRFHK